MFLLLILFCYCHPRGSHATLSSQGKSPRPGRAALPPSGSGSTEVQSHVLPSTNHGIVPGLAFHSRDKPHGPATSEGYYQGSEITLTSALLGLCRRKRMGVDCIFLLPKSQPSESTVFSGSLFPSVLSKILRTIPPSVRDNMLLCCPSFLISYFVG